MRIKEFKNLTPGGGGYAIGAISGLGGVACIYADYIEGYSPVISWGCGVTNNSAGRGFVEVSIRGYEVFLFGYTDQSYNGCICTIYEKNS